MVSKPVKCYFSCIFESSGVLIDGKPNKEIVQMVPNASEAAQISRVIEICDSLNSEDICEAGYQFFKCFLAYKSSNENNKKK